MKEIKKKPAGSSAIRQTRPSSWQVKRWQLTHIKARLGMFHRYRSYVHAGIWICFSTFLGGERRVGCEELGRPLNGKKKIKRNFGGEENPETMWKDGGKVLSNDILELPL